jgi:gas vesicle protein
MYRLRYVAVALVAGTVGAAVALLLAPDTGRNTRKKLARRMERERQRAARQSRRMLDDASGYVEERVKDGRRMVEGVADDVGERLEKGRKKIGRIVGA